MNGSARTATQRERPAASSGDATAELMGLMRGFVVSKTLYVAAELGLADLLADGPRKAEDLARATETNPQALYRVLRALSSVGLFAEQAPGSFVLADRGRALLTGAPGSLRHWVLTNGGPIFRAFDEMLSSVRTGQPAFERTFGTSFFRYLEQTPCEEAVFSAAMEDVARQTAGPILDAYDFAGVTEVVDVGGGNGTLLASILQGHPSTRGTLFDRPQVVAGGRRRMEALGLASRCRFVRGDFFEAVPSGGDLYVLSWIVHDWDDERALTILRNCRGAIPETGRLLLVEAVVPPGDEPHFSKFGDIVMLVALGGQERTEAQYRALLAEAGFRLTRIVPTSSPRSLIEAVPTPPPGGPAQ